MVSEMKPSGTIILKSFCLFWGAWVVPLIEPLTLDLSSGLELRVMSSSLSLGSTHSVEPT